ncbi:MAG: hypothetical protein IJD42_05310 [Clostridia bacterium]|nr:hypothetical protein [Clostridia bacterium]
MRILVEQIKTSIDSTDEDIFEIARARILKSRAFSHFSSMHIHKRSIDARHKNDIKFVSSVCADVECTRTPSAELLLKYQIKLFTSEKLEFSLKGEMPQNSPLIVGFGPAGMFCALALAKAGMKPIVIERGADIDSRVECINEFYRSKTLNTETNIQFGAGGAGTFSDGKLTTRISDPKCMLVLEMLCENGAPEDIKFKAKPHIGTDNLRKVVKSIDEQIRALGGVVLYNTKLISFDDSVAKTTKGDIKFSSIVLALGHSARDTYAYLMKSGFAIEAKPFSVGVRVEHLQDDINEAMYGKYANDRRLGVADYNVSYRENGRGVYSFCMCPGGEVVCASSEEGGVVVNGMSRYARDGKNANSAIAVQVNTADYGNDPIKAIEFQRTLERNAFISAGANYNAPVQTLGDFYNGVSINEPNRIIPSYMNAGVTSCDMNKILPRFVCDYLKKGFFEFGKRIKGFNATDVPITGVETRTSAPLRILRTENYTAFAHPNVYPCGEGAGYAGGIMSAACDGLNVALAILNK